MPINNEIIMKLVQQNNELIKQNNEIINMLMNDKKNAGDIDDSDDDINDNSVIDDDSDDDEYTASKVHTCKCFLKSIIDDVGVLKGGVRIKWRRYSDVYAVKCKKKELYKEYTEYCKNLVVRDIIHIVNLFMVCPIIKVQALRLNMIVI